MYKMKIDVLQASEFMKLGYEIECHVLIPKVKQDVTKRIINAVIPGDANLRVSVDHKGPSKGRYQVIWGKLKKKLWTNGSPTEAHTRTEIEGVLKQIAPDIDPGFFTYLVNNKQCLRVTNGD